MERATLALLVSPSQIQRPQILGRSRDTVLALNSGAAPAAIPHWRRRLFSWPERHKHLPCSNVGGPSWVWRCRRWATLGMPSTAPSLTTTDAWFAAPPQCTRRQARLPLLTKNHVKLGHFEKVAGNRQFYRCSTASQRLLFRHPNLVWH